VEDQVLHPNFRRGDATPPQATLTLRKSGGEQFFPWEKTMGRRHARRKDGIQYTCSKLRWNPQKMVVL